MSQPPCPQPIQYPYTPAMEAMLRDVLAFLAEQKAAQSQPKVGA